jgi:hypothetical protein
LIAELGKRMNSSSRHFTLKAPCLLRHIFLTRDFPGVSPICGELFRSKLYTKGLSWHYISWHYPFNQVSHHIPQ